MLEYAFNELDNDFVTLWSRYIVSGEDVIIFQDLTKLAELGQINAIQSWYLLAKRNDDNIIIDNNVKKLGNSGANQLLAKANYDYFKNNRLNQLSIWYEQYVIQRGWYLDEDLDNKVRTCDYITKSKFASELYYTNYELTHNILSLERFYEMMLGRTEIHKKLSKIEKYTSRKEFDKLRKALLLQYKEDKNNVALAFALGKNLTLFNSNEELKALGTQILTKLSNRELSSTLQNYEIKGTKCLIKKSNNSVKKEENSSELSAQDKYENDMIKNIEQIEIDIEFKR